jgi:hypothetical protein
MKPFFSHPLPVLAASVWLALAMSVAACSEEGNPVIPPSGGGGPSGGGEATGTGDALSGGDAGQAVEDTATYATPDSISVAQTCDLLAQDCPPPGGCYPVSGVARCRVPGGVPTQGSCNLGNDQPDCLPGLTCIPSSTLGSAGICTPICDVLNPTATCGFGNVCLQPLPGFPRTGNVGYCQFT